MSGPENGIAATMAAEPATAGTRCMRCATVNPPGMNFCRNCGTGLDVGAGAGQAGGPAAGIAPGRAAAPPAALPASAAPTVAARGQAVAAAPAAEPLDAGRPQRRTCPHCGTMTPTGYAFCQHCGKNLPSMPEAVRAGVMVSGETSGDGRGREPAPGPARAPQPAQVPREAPQSPAFVHEPTPPPVRTAPVAAPPAAASPGLGSLAIGPTMAPPAVATPSLPATARRPTPPAGQPVVTPVARPVIEAPRPVSRPPFERTPAPFPPAGDARPAFPPAGELPASTPRSTPEATATVTWGTLVAVKSDGTDGARFPLAGNWVDVGRSQADISFVEDRFLAPRHMRLVRAGNAVRAMPLDTLNGVFRRVRGPVELDDGDVLLMGQELLRFELVEADERESMPLVRHGVALFGSPARAPWARISHLLASGGVRDVRHLYQGVFTIGREEGDWTFPDDAFLSRRHATLSWLDDCCTLEDPGSSNGTFIRLTGATEVKDGDHLRIGDHLLRLELG